MKKSVLVTGASSGIGKETAKLLTNNGYTVYGIARRIEMMNELKNLGVRMIKMDVADEQQKQNQSSVYLDVGF